MCNYLNEEVIVPEMFHVTDTDCLIGHLEFKTRRQVASFNTQFEGSVGEDFEGFKKRIKENDVDQCLIPLLVKLHSIGRPTQASCCGHYEWISTEKSEKHPWINAFVRPNVYDVQDTLNTILKYHPDWPNEHIHIRAKDWIRNDKILSASSWCLSFQFPPNKIFDKQYIFGKLNTNNINEFTNWLRTKHGYNLTSLSKDSQYEVSELDIKKRQQNHEGLMEAMENQSAKMTDAEVETINRIYESSF